ncbi:hypothetical protein [uncultured Ferrovibrio sp.]|jgi:protein involved in sex pheromone biosynthesis|uniref:hypothetical protein n=1 Tax=uncultured Ferrovibrio sp. TaxID=1576913 RepID=UPI00262053A3|nr:hypothetical protein [uncultured Ferrovibrio sp.]
MLRISPLAVVLTLAGCGPQMEWTKPNVSMMEAEADTAECARLARDQAFRESYSMPFAYYPWSPYGFPRYRRYSYGPFDDPFMSRMQREHELRSFCLRARGYSLTPVPPS